MIPEEEKIFLQKLNAFGIKDPKIIESPSGLLYTYSEPEANHTWKASFYQDDNELYHFEIEFDK